MTRFDFIYPILFAIYPVFALLASNLGEVPPSDSFRSFAIAAALGIVVWVIFSIFLKDSQRGAILVSGYLILFFSYGQIYDQIEGLSIGSFLVGRHRYLLLMWLIAIISWTVWIVRRRRVHSGAKKALLVVVLTLLAIPMTSVISYYRAEAELVEASDEFILAQGDSSIVKSELPNIFYIVVDAYGRSDILRELYGVDNLDFIEYLESQGFYVANQSTSNYASTLFSLASSLNMQYLDHLIEIEGPESENLRPLDEMVAHSETREIFTRMGYEFVAFETGYFRTEIRDAEHYLAPDHDDSRDISTIDSIVNLNEFEGMLLSTSLFRAANEYYTRSQLSARSLLDYSHQRHRTRVKFTLDSLQDIAGEEDNFFVFAHIVSPHKPYVFGKNGEVVYDSEAFTLAENHSRNNDEFYADQTIYITKLLKRTIDEILERSQTPPIIILQSDHGPNIFESRSEMSFEAGMQERFSILNTYLVPDDVITLLYPAITPVNSFRAILSGHFGFSINLLGDEMYFSRRGHPYDVIRITDVLTDIPY